MSTVRRCCIGEFDNDAGGMGDEGTEAGGSGETEGERDNEAIVPEISEMVKCYQNTIFINLPIVLPSPLTCVRI